MNKEQFIIFMEIVRQSLIRNKSWRFGQAIWNEGSTLYPELFEQYRSTECDPFYSNERVNSLFEKILDEETLEAWYRSNLYLKTV